jgi:hypothetical protein
MIRVTDTEIAERLATKYQGSAVFGRDDAYQACIEGLLKAGVNAPQGVKVKAMRDEMHRQSVEASYLMRVPWSSWKKMAETPAHVRHTGLDTDTLVEYESPSTATLDWSMEVVEDTVDMTRAMKTLNEQDLKVLEWAMSQYRKGTRPGGPWFYKYKAVVSKLREALL